MLSKTTTMFREKLKSSQCFVRFCSSSRSTTSYSCPKNFFLPFLLVTILSFHFLNQNVMADDAEVMAKLAASLSPTPTGWSGNNPCKWPGVDCNQSGRVVAINLVSRSISGELPSDLSQLSALKYLSLQRNRLSGALPSLSNLAALQDVNLDSNNFSFVPPNFLSGLTSLQTFSANDNSLLSPWTIPESLKDSTALVSFSASKANVVGSIPDIFGSFPSLETVRLSYNNLTGTLPMSFANSGIKSLLLNNQAMKMEGTIDVLGSMAELNQVWLQVNSFSGPIPDLSKCLSLSDLQLRDNHLTGLIPPSLTSLPSLLNASLQNNVFQGPVPVFSTKVQVNLGTDNSFCNSSPGPCDPQVTILLQVASALGYPLSLAESWKGNNACDSNNWIFITCTKGMITTINFSKQNFTGFISPAIANLTSLKSLMLNDNKLRGRIPETLATLTQLEVLDVSNNNITGPVPQFPPGAKVITTGNPFIKIDIPDSSSTPPGSPPSESKEKSSAKDSNKVWIILGLTVVVMVLLIGLGFLGYKCLIRNRKRKYRWFQGNEKGIEQEDNNISDDKNTNGYDTSPSELPSTESPVKKNDFDIYNGGNAIIPIEVLRQVTNNFSEDNVVGSGGFGIVYKGQLHDGTQVAVKRMESGLISNKGESEFKAEIEVLTKVRHRNLVALHGFCDNGNEKLLVYEYMPDGTLSDHLFRYKELGFPPLTWKQRISIALDVARGVEYLHALARESFIHRDLKPSNILLGGDMRAKVSDFGLVKNAPNGKHSMATKLAGTFGYLAPEYAATGRVTTKIDVYAFGTILMEMITARRALEDKLPDDKVHLVTWFRKIITNKEELRNSIDDCLSPDSETFASICKVAELAGHCTTREPSQRPDMSHAVNVLAPLVQQWQPTALEEDEGTGIDFNMSLPQVLEKWKANDGASDISYGFIPK